MRQDGQGEIRLRQHFSHGRRFASYEVVHPKHSQRFETKVGKEKRRLVHGQVLLFAQVSRIRTQAFIDSRTSRCFGDFGSASSLDSTKIVRLEIAILSEKIFLPALVLSHHSGFPLHRKATHHLGSSIDFVAIQNPGSSCRLKNNVFVM